VLPFAVIACTLAVEYFLIGDDQIRVQLGGGLNDVLKQTLDLEKQMSQLMTGLATATIGGVSYYLKREPPRDLHNRALATAILVGAASSIFFGQLWMAAIRDQLVHDYIDFSAHPIVWPERLQGCLFLLSLLWFAPLSLAREPDARKLSEVRRQRTTELSKSAT
jgi:hypothetical protein